MALSKKKALYGTGWQRKPGSTGVRGAGGVAEGSQAGSQHQEYPPGSKRRLAFTLPSVTLSSSPVQEPSYVWPSCCGTLQTGFLTCPCIS